MVVSCKQSAAFTKSRSNHGGTRFRLVKCSEPVWPNRVGVSVDRQWDTSVVSARGAKAKALLRTPKVAPLEC